MTRTLSRYGIARKSQEGLSPIDRLRPTAYVLSSGIVVTTFSFFEALPLTRWALKARRRFWFCVN